jgi:capsular exopolysaccharide synthesis family protein
MTKPTYQATATIELNKSSGGSLSLNLEDAVSQQLTTGNDLQIDLQTETSILQGDSLALDVIERLKLDSVPPFAVKTIKDPEAGLPLEQSPRTRGRLLAAFRGHLKVQPTRGTRLIKVSFESHDPNQAAVIANALIDSYKSQYLQSHYNATSETSDWLTKQLSELKANVEESEKELTNFEKESGILSLQAPGVNGSTGSSEIHSVVIEKLDALNNELTAAEANRIEKEAIYRLVSGGSEEMVAGLGQDSLAIKSQSNVLTEGGGLSNLQNLRAKRNEVKMAIAQAASIYGPNNRHLMDLQTQERLTDEQIRSEMQEIAKRAEGDFLLAKRTEEVVRKRFEEQQAEAGKLNEKTVQFAVLSEEASSRKKLYEDLYTRLQEANVSAGIKATNITVVDPARTQSGPIRPKWSTSLEVGFLAGVFLGLVLAFAIDSLDRTVVNPLEIEDITSMPVIGIIPTFGNSSKAYGYGYGYGSSGTRGSGATKNKTTEGEGVANDTVWILQHPESAAAEAFRSLRTSILLSQPGGGPRVILLTSCVPGEGKSTLSANLAVSFAQHGKKVVIIEADMRRPTMKHVLEVSNESGLSSVLSGSLSLEQAITRGILVPTLDVLPAGPRPPLPSELLGSSAFDNLLEELRGLYDIVIVDSPPALLLTDAVSIASKTDAVVWVSRAGVVTRPQLARAAQLTERNAIPVIGFVLNCMDKTVDVYGYGYGYGYDYKHYRSYYGEEETNGK